MRNLLGWLETRLAQNYLKSNQNTFVCLFVTICCFVWKQMPTNKAPARSSTRPLPDVLYFAPRIQYPCIISIYISININIYLYVYIYICIHMCIYTYTHIYVERERERDVYIYIYIYAYIYTHVYIYIYIYMFWVKGFESRSVCFWNGRLFCKHR